MKIQTVLFVSAAAILCAPWAGGMNIGSIPKLTYTPGALEYFQFIRGGIGADYHQEPKFYQYPDGEVLAYWSAYDQNETSANSVKLYATSKDRGLTWSDPEVFMADFLRGVPYFVQILRLGDDDEALMFLTRTRHGRTYFQSTTRVYVRRSTDAGRTFGHGEEIPHERITGGEGIQDIGFYGSIDDVLQLESGRIVLALMFMDPKHSDPERGIQQYSLVCMLSDDGGHTWKRSGEITVDTPRGAMECQMVETDPDRLLCLFRTKGGYVYQSVSEDGGETWSESEPTALPSPESMVRMIKLESGNLLVVWNNVSSTSQRPRHPLAATISKDGGRTWTEPRIIADETGTNQLSNHGMIQLDDGRILLGISHYRDVKPMTSDFDIALFDEAWVLSKKRHQR